MRKQEQKGNLQETKEHTLTTNEETRTEENMENQEQ
jgi:hypothetical protein